LKSEKNFKEFTNSLYKQKWVTYCKDTIQDSEKVIDYLGRYAYRVAISNRRILNTENGKVIFKYRDYRDNQVKTMKLEAVEFIRRFLLHILPEGFFKIRYYGILANRNLKTKLKKCRDLLKPKDSDSCLSWKQLYFKITGKPLNLCPVCQIGIIITCILNHSPPSL
jgi:MoaA/NifB/PqqE/SkfB family radical SAM enzyme